MQIHIPPQLSLWLALPFFLQLIRNTSARHLLTEFITLLFLLASISTKNYCNKLVCICSTAFLIVLDVELIQGGLTSCIRPSLKSTLLQVICNMSLVMNWIQLACSLWLVQFMYKSYSKSRQQFKPTWLDSTRNHGISNK